MDDVTHDGSPVEVYRRLPALGEPEFIDARIPPGSTILDLGAGTGRIADPLVALGHRVVAVDNSAAMLANVQQAETVLADIATLRDPRTFAAVLLASRLVNTPSTELRRQLLATVAHHLAPGGTAFIEWHRPEWFDSLHPGLGRPGAIGPVTATLDVASMHDGLLTASVTYRTDSDAWEQRFTARRLDRETMAGDLAAVGLRLSVEHDDWLLVTTAPIRP
jgi:SAM-dependent methyltransferase